MMQVANLFTHASDKYIVAFRSFENHTPILLCSRNTLEEAELALTTHKSLMRKYARVKIFEAIGNTDRMYIDVKEVTDD